MIGVENNADGVIGRVQNQILLQVATEMFQNGSIGIKDFDPIPIAVIVQFNLRILSLQRILQFEGIKSYIE